MNEEELENDSTQEKLSVGEILRSKREELGLSVGDVTERLNLPIKYVEALETENYSVLPNQVFLQGYMKSYAKLLDLDAEPLLEDIRSVVDIPTPKSAINRDIKPIKPIRKPHELDIAKYIKAAIFLLVLGLSSWFFFGGDKEEELSLETPENSSNEAYLEGVNELAEVDVSVSSEVPPVAQINIEAATVNTPTDSAIQELPLGETRNEQITQTINTSSFALSVNQSTQTLALDAAQLLTKDERLAARTEELKESLLEESSVTVLDTSELEKIDSDGSDVVVLQYLEDAWTEIYDADDKRLVYATKGAGQRLQVTGKAPFFVKLGRATAVIASFNGEPVSIVAKNAASSASFILE